MAVTKDFIIEEDVPFVKTLYYMDQAQRPHDLSGYSAELVIKDAPGGTTLLSLTSPSGLAFLGAGAIRITLTDTSSSAITWLTGVYQLHLTAPNGNILRLLEGTFTFSPTI